MHVMPVSVGCRATENVFCRQSHEAEPSEAENGEES